MKTMKHDAMLKLYIDIRHKAVLAEADGKKTVSVKVGELLDMLTYEDLTFVKSAITTPEGGVYLLTHDPTWCLSGVRLMTKRKRFELACMMRGGVRLHKGQVPLAQNETQKIIS